MSSNGVISNAAPWKVVKTHTVHDAPPYLKLSVETVELPDGRVVDDYHQVHLPDYSIAVPILVDGSILTLWQYKHGARCYSMTFPAGHVEPGEDAVEAMLRELREETGYVAEKAIGFGSYTVSGNQGCGRAHLFALTGCRPVGVADHDDLETFDLKVMTVEEINAAVDQGHCTILPQLAVWLATRAHFGF
ncbi:NUDIX hydrolase [Agrobacterium tumefaciens]|uniref:NUDIX hydrolase n=1 Tax=Agrobacterium tumefaciens TaxID=358 RepID=UPI001571A390|nr:NUDIX hydrolase [Agrobacterium tumefaciens]NTB05217.1 NUDIX hydrolase [Agrobacterium tumefaciens]